MKKLLCILLSLLLCVMFALIFTGCGETYVNEINVYNWGEYISDGSEDYVDLIDKFESEYGIKVNYTTYETNEELYNILKTTNSPYDVIIPSDYMVEKLINEGLIQKLNLDNIPNRKYLMERFKNPSFDPTGEYTVAYMWGVVAMVYNTEMVSEKPTSWNSLWDETLSGSILQFNNSRDAYAIALQLCHKDPTNCTLEDIDLASEKLLEQKPLLKRYAMDQTFTEMENDQAAIAPYYLGDILTMMDNNPNLDYALPKEGSNLYVDAMCIPTCAQNKEGAEKFINFMTDPQNAKDNVDYVYYSSPVQQAYDKQINEDGYPNPSDEYFEKCYTFNDLDKDVYLYMQEQFIHVMAK